jgi:hypothetical protein
MIGREMSGIRVVGVVLAANDLQAQQNIGRSPF